MTKKLMLKQLASMLASFKRKKKYYCEVEYLESSGTQYIDTGIVPTNEMEFYSKINFTSISGGDVSVIAARVGNNNRCQPIFTYANKWTVAIGSAYDPYGASVSTNTDYDIKSVITEGKTITLYANGSQVASLTSPSGIANVPFYIFARNYDALVDAYSSLKMNYMKIYSGGVLVRDFIPVLDWNMRPALYDKVSDQLFYNQGTGEFTHGREIHYVEYLERPVDESSGSSMWINTGLKYFADFEVGVSLRESTVNTCLGTSSTERLERNSATYPQWKFTSAEEGAYASNISIVGYHELKWKDGKIYADGVQLATKAKTSTASTYPMALFGIPTSETAANAYHNVIYFCKLWNPIDGTLVRDYIPAIDENGVGYMFDKVTHTIYDNAGTGAFKYPAREVEYLQSSGTQYIDTGYVPTNTTGVQVKHTICADNGTDNILFGCRQDSADTRFWEDLDWGNDDSIGWGYGGYSNQDPTYSTYRCKLISSDVGKTVVSRLNYLNSRNCSIDDNIRNLPSTTLPTITRPIYIFAGNNQGSFGIPNACKIFTAQISEGSALVRDYIPCYKDGVACMVDKVNNVFYSNAGTGTFVVGKIKESEYLE